MLPDAVPRELQARIHPAPSGCWMWLGPTTDGYGRVYRVAGSTYAHRRTYEHAHGPMPAGMVLGGDAA